MAEKTVKTYSESPEIRMLAEAIKDRYYLYVGHVDLDTVHFAEITGAAKPKKAKVGEISGISSPWVRQLIISLGNSRLYCMAVWSEEYEELSPASREWLVFEALYSIHPECDGKLRKPDVVEHGPIVEYFASTNVGLYWRKAEILPSLLSGDAPLPIPPPAFEDAEGDSTF